MATRDFPASYFDTGLCLTRVPATNPRAPQPLFFYCSKSQQPAHKAVAPVQPLRPLRSTAICVICVHRRIKPRRTQATREKRPAAITTQEPAAKSVQSADRQKEPFSQTKKSPNRSPGFSTRSGGDRFFRSSGLRACLRRILQSPWHRTHPGHPGYGW